MIYIDFQGGAHGNYLEYVCNRFLANIKTNASPFDSLGASHNKKYATPKQFSAGHYFEYDGVKTHLYNSKVISIQITADDILSLNSVSFLRAGNWALDNDLLEIDTFNKLNNKDYKWMLQILIDSFFQDTRIADYYNIKDPTWPNISTIDDYENLPRIIRDECEQVFGLRAPVFSENFSDCPRNILREFFKIGFQHPENQGFITRQKKMTYDVTNEVYVFPYSCFYNHEQFTNEIAKVASWTGYNFTNSDQFVNLHSEFLQKQIYKDAKTKCDALFDRVLNREHFVLPNLTLLEESYLDSRLEKHYNKQSPVDILNWFSSSTQILDYYTKNL